MILSIKSFCPIPVLLSILPVWSAMAAPPLSDAESDAAIARNRQGVIVIRAKPGAAVSVTQLRHEFWFGAALPNSVFSGRAASGDIAKFKEIFLSHFNAGVTEVAFKWHDLEKEKGKIDFSTLDAMLEWADANSIPLRGHCIFWGIPNRVMDWQKQLSDEALRLVVRQHARMIGARYRGRFAEYDLNNEMIHANYYAERFGPDFIKQMALWVKEGDPDAALYFNDYDIATGRRLDDYVKDIRRVLDLGTPMAGIGVQGHLHGDSFDAEALWNSLEVLSQFKLPIRITEFNFPGQRSKFYKDRNAEMTPEEERAKAEALTRYFRICFAHPSVTGIMMWGFWEGANWIRQSSLYKRDWTPAPAAQAYKDLVLKKWWTNFRGTAGPDGLLAVPAYYGRHRVTVDGKETVVELKRAEGSRVISFQ
jgi:GH35 family endo-1,4-beta-xylanase